MKKKGVVSYYDGDNGKILGEDNNMYELYKKNTLEEIRKGDKVYFEVEDYIGVEVKKKVAMFVRKNI